jgi:hypothetical protein
VDRGSFAQTIRGVYSIIDKLSMITNYGDLKIRREDFVIFPVRTLFKTIPELVVNLFNTGTMMQSLLPFSKAPFSIYLAAKIQGKYSYCR